MKKWQITLLVVVLYIIVSIEYYALLEASLAHEDMVNVLQKIHSAGNNTVSYATTEKETIEISYHRINTGKDETQELTKKLFKSVKKALEENSWENHKTDEGKGYLIPLGETPDE